MTCAQVVQVPIKSSIVCKGTGSFICGFGLHTEAEEENVATHIVAALEMGPFQLPSKGQESECKWKLEGNVLND